VFLLGCNGRGQSPVEVAGIFNQGHREKAVAAEFCGDTHCRFSLEVWALQVQGKTPRGLAEFA
jgi:hypothetical protein